MWINPLFAADARASVAELVRSHSLATLFVADPLHAAHLPLLLHQDGADLELIGHVPRADPLADAVLAGTQVLCVFHGPRAYVSPSWYTGPGLPTYNFTVAHLTGTVTAMQDPAELRAHLLDLVADHERFRTHDDRTEWSPDEAAHARMEQLLPQVVGFRIAVTHARAKAKLGQNRTPQDRARTATELAASHHVEENELAQLMEEHESTSGGTP